MNGGNDGNDDDNDENDDDIDDEAFVACAPAPLDTFFVKSVSQGGSAHEAGLKSGMWCVCVFLWFIKRIGNPDKW